MQRQTKQKKHKNIQSLQQSSLFRSQEACKDMLTNLRQNKLFRKSILKPIQNTNKVHKTRKKINQQDSWIQNISCIEQPKVYEPRRIIEHQKNQLFEKFGVKLKEILKKEKPFNHFCQKPIDKQRSTQNNFEDRVCRDTIKSVSLYHKQCYINKMKALKETSHTCTANKQAQMAKVWPNFNYKTIKDSIKKLKSLNFSGHNSPNFETSFQERKSKKKRKLKNNINKQTQPTLLIDLQTDKKTDNIPQFLMQIIQP